MIVEEREQTELALSMPSPEDRLPRLAGLALTVVVALLIAALLVKGVASAATASEMFFYPFQFDESEGMIVAETMLMDQGVGIFALPTPDLFISAPYPPLFYLLNWPIQHLSGAEPTFKGGRALSLLSALFVGVAIFGIVSSLTRDRLAGVVGGLAWWSLSLVTYWGSLVKPDVLAVALGLAGLWWLISRPQTQVWWALPFFLGAIYTKQTAIAAAVAAVGWLLFTRPRTALAFGGLYAVSAVVPTLALNWLTDGGYFYHLFTIHDLPWFEERYGLFVGNFLATYWPFVLPGTIVLLAMGVVWLVRRLRKEAQPVPRGAALLLFFYLGMTIVASVGTGTHGGQHNHLLEWAASSCLGLGMGIAMLRRINVWQARVASALAGVLVLAFVPGLFTHPGWMRAEFGQLDVERRGAMMSIFQYVTNNGGTAYSDNVSLLLTARKKLWTTDPFTQTHATEFGRWDESKLVGAISGRSFDQIILRVDVFEPGRISAGDVSPAILQAVKDNYKLDQGNVENIYVPR
ncbi:MAG TPA: hypothetical protein VEX13_16115 [Chloroflexia bacterium]|nr:hypothetical protein [Chloroflexia bacterium]